MSRKRQLSYFRELIGSPAVCGSTTSSSVISSSGSFFRRTDVLRLPDVDAPPAVRQLLPPALNRFFVQSGDLAKFAVRGLTGLLRECTDVPAPLGFIQTTQQQVHPVVLLHDYRITPCAANLTFTLMHFFGHLGQPRLFWVALYPYSGSYTFTNPYYHPASNGSVERFHQDYNAYVWTDTELTDISAIQRRAEDFFAQYRDSHHHTALAGHTPAEIHQQTPPSYLAAHFTDTQEKLPLVPGRVHFLRQVSASRTVKILNHDWEVSTAEPQQGVWATLEITSRGAT